MRRTIISGTALVLPLLLAAGILTASGQNATEQKAAMDKGKELFELVCAGCHGLDLATTLKNSKEQWNEIVQSMVDKGAYVKKDDIPLIVNYLAATYGIQQTPPKEQPAAGGKSASATDAEMKKLVESACAGCHDYGLVSEKRATREDWDNTVRSMVDRGAELKPEQIPPAVDYLAKTFPNK